MKIVELDDVECDRDESVCHTDKQMVRVDAKRALVGAGARILFYPTLLYNVFRNKIQAEFRWWDEVDQVFFFGFPFPFSVFWFHFDSIDDHKYFFQYILLGAVPFPKDVPRLKGLGVGGVITLNESYETLVPTSLYHVS